MRYPMHAFILVLVVVAACGGPTGQTAVDQAPATSLDNLATEVLAVVVSTEMPPAGTTDAQPITLSGSGKTATNPFMVSWDNARVIFSHNGDHNFVVTAHQDGAEYLLADSIGKVEGTRALLGAGETYFDIDANGDWTIRIEPLGQADGAPFAGSGPAVSGLFDAPAPGPWSISHDGSRNFVVNLHCANRSDLIQNKIGKVVTSSVVPFGTAPCFWEVEADGNWSLAPE